MMRTNDHPAGCSTDCLAQVSDERFTAELGELAAVHAPRRFALVVVRADPRDGWAFGWGVDFTDQAVLTVPPSDETAEDWITRRFADAEAARRDYARFGDIRLYWVDPEC